MSDLLDNPPWDGIWGLKQVASARPIPHTHRMPVKFLGNLQELKDRLLPLDLDGDWQPQPNRVWKFRCRDRAGILWAETTGRVWFDGPQMPKAALEAQVETVLADGAIVQPAAAGSQIFVVHGRDHDARDQLRLVLFSLRLEPFVLQVTGGGGDTLKGSSLCFR